MINFNSIALNYYKLAEIFSEWSDGIDWNSLHDRLEYIENSLTQDLQNESIRLMNRGWFIWFLDGYLSDFNEKELLLIGKNDNEQDEFMTKYITENLSYFKSELCIKHPSRRNQIEDAFKCHEIELYFSSVPTLLALSEGIGRDFYPNIGIFAKKRDKLSKAKLPKTDDIFNSVSGLELFEEAILKPLRVSSDLTMSIEKPTENDKKKLNRHLIMHGHSNLYGHKENSLKAISLLFFMHKSLELLKNSTIT